MEDCLGHCLDSLLVGNSVVFQLLEVIVVNDGSTDGTSALAHSYANRFPGVFSVIDKKNGNSGSCINAGLAAATGKYFKQLDADDWFDTELLEKFILLLRDREEDLVSTPHRNCFASGDTILYEAKGVEYGRTYLMDELPMPGKNVAVLSMHSLAYKLDFLRGFGHWQQEGMYYTDVEQCYFATANARDIYFSDLCLYQYYFGREGQSVTYPMYSKHREHLLKVSLRVVRDYVNRISDAMTSSRRIILISQALESVKPVYWVYLLLEPENPDFRELDRLVLSCPELNRYAESACVVKGIPYLRMWHINGITPHFMFV